MTDRDKIIKWLECCGNYDEDLNQVGCTSECPYWEGPNSCDPVKPFRDALELLKELMAKNISEEESRAENISEWVEDSDPGQELGTTWACIKCLRSIHEPFVWNPYECKMNYCPFCGKRMVN